MSDNIIVVRIGKGKIFVRIFITFADVSNKKTEVVMELKETLLKRRSIRKFENRPVDRQTIEQLLAETFTAPSSRNTRSSRFMVVTDRQNMERISTMRDYGAAFMKDAPAAILPDLAHAGCTSTAVRASRQNPTGNRPRSTCGHSCPFRRHGDHCALSPSDIRQPKWLPTRKKTIPTR